MNLETIVVEKTVIESPHTKTSKIIVHGKKAEAKRMLVELRKQGLPERTVQARVRRFLMS